MQQIVNYDDNLTFRLGVETEFILPFNNGKWGVFLEPNFIYFKGQTNIRKGQVVVKEGVATADFKMIQVPLGIRHYFFLTDGVKLFVNPSINFEGQINSEISFSSGFGSPLELSGGASFGVGLGFNIKDKFTAEAKYFVGREILEESYSWYSNFSQFSLIAGYSLYLISLALLTR